MHVERVDAIDCYLLNDFFVIILVFNAEEDGGGSTLLCDLGLEATAQPNGA